MARHDGAIWAPGRHLDFVGDRVGVDDQAVVSRHADAGGQVGEESGSVVEYGQRVSMNRGMQAQPTSECETDGLMAQADAEEGKTTDEVLHDRHEASRVFGTTGAGPQDHTVGHMAADCLGCRLVAVHDVDVCSDREKALDEVPGERIVAIDQNDAHEFPRCGHGI